MIIHISFIASLIVIANANGILTSLIKGNIGGLGLGRLQYRGTGGAAGREGRLGTECEGNMLIGRRLGIESINENWRIGKIGTDCTVRGVIEERRWKDRAERDRMQANRITLGLGEGKLIENRRWGALEEEGLRLRKGRIGEERMGIGRWGDLGLERGRTEEGRLDAGRWERIGEGLRLEKDRIGGERLELGREDRWWGGIEGKGRIGEERLGLVLEDRRWEGIEEKGRIGEERLGLGLEDRRWGGIEEKGRMNEERLGLGREGRRWLGIEEKGRIGEDRLELGREDRRWGGIEEKGGIGGERLGLGGEDRRWGGTEEGIRLEKGRIGEGRIRIGLEDGLKLENDRLEGGLRLEKSRIGEGRIALGLEDGLRVGNERIGLEKGRIGLEDGLRLGKGRIEEERIKLEDRRLEGLDQRLRLGEGSRLLEGSRWGEAESLKLDRGIGEVRIESGLDIRGKGEERIGELGKERVIDVYARPKYEFNYGVRDPKTGDRKEQSEVRVDDVVKGEYSLAEPDGTIRVVRYEADDKNGFNARVDRIGKALHPEQYGWRPLGREIKNLPERL